MKYTTSFSIAASWEKHYNTDSKYKKILRKNIGFYTNSKTVVLNYEAIAPIPALHIPDAVAGKMKKQTVLIANLAQVQNTQSLKQRRQETISK